MTKPIALFPSDVYRLLRALDSAARDRGPEYHAALNDVGTALGVPLHEQARPFVQVIDAYPSAGFFAAMNPGRSG